MRQCACRTIVRATKAAAPAATTLEQIDASPRLTSLQTVSIPVDVETRGKGNALERWRSRTAGRNVVYCNETTLKFAWRADQIAAEFGRYYTRDVLPSTAFKLDYLRGTRPQAFS